MDTTKNAAPFCVWTVFDELATAWMLQKRTTIADSAPFDMWVLIGMLQECPPIAFSMLFDVISIYSRPLEIYFLEVPCLLAQELEALKVSAFLFDIFCKKLFGS